MINTCQSLSSADVDYTPLTSVPVILSDMVQTVTLTIIDDDIVEAMEDLLVTMETVEKRVILDQRTTVVSIISDDGKLLHNLPQ